MKLLNIDSIPGKKIEAISLVRGTVVYSKNFGKDFMASIKGLVGGEIESYTEMLNEARAIATKRMVDQAEALEADAIVNVRYGSSSLMQSAAEIVAYGTAVKILGDA
ncbi:MAG: YbjQ family protein [Oscillospiraceae bacterium]|nr:YbjQ family protein [Oscillospiraceae bacterium]